MLATQKGVYHYEEGKLVDFEVDTSDYSGWFFMCCVIIGEIMELCKKRYKGEALHYWVDGIALSGGHGSILIMLISGRRTVN